MERIKKIGEDWYGFCEDCKRDERKMINKQRPICLSCWNKRKYLEKKESGYTQERIYVPIEEVEALINKIKRYNYNVDAILTFEILNMWLNITSNKITKYDDFNIEDQLIMMITDIIKYHKKSK